ncbi:hypothetical protein [Flavisolibacter ginsengisoli]|jgi:hypothetical protein|uniref:Uncharacterized protein n=1 Tax=Flavisolibacter ginsengisoli DSM 18119 TaxID=1121884 RepID=A0A1M5CH26_9BACT|nr:hypothetical protein [Flavisolibacter ginsengisoli]SHF53692.1 hypothetical protein SAMN02745131_02927 [Flavisolibacter ginsengisoli DSM 18119]
MKKKIFDKDLRQICLDYVKLLLEVKYGCRVEQDGSSMEVWSPKGYKRNLIKVDVENNASPTVGILIARMINGRKVPVITDYHIVKFIGVEGVYSLEEEKLQELLLDNNIPQITSEDGYGIYSIFDKQLLLDNCSFVAA